MSELLFPVGFHVGDYPVRLDSAATRPQARVGWELRPFASALHHEVWWMLHGEQPAPTARRWDADQVVRSYLEMIAERDETEPPDIPTAARVLPDEVAAAIDDLLADGLAVAVTDDLAAFLAGHRLGPLLRGAGGIREQPLLMTLGLTGSPLATIDIRSFEYWVHSVDGSSLAELVDGLADALGSEHREELQRGMLDDLRVLLASGAAYLDVVVDRAPA